MPTLSSTFERLGQSVRILLLLVAQGAGADSSPVVEHRIEARIDPASGLIQVTDRLALPEGQDAFELILHRDMAPRIAAGQARLEPMDAEAHLQRYLLRLEPKGDRAATLSYRGTIRHDLAAEPGGMGRSQESSIGTIDPTGVFLDGASGWYPMVPGSLQRFSLKTALPPGWSAVSQGAGPGSEPGVSNWSESQPQDDIYLIAATFSLYSDKFEGIDTQVWLRQPDAELAKRYLSAAGDYLKLYDGLIGPYPYAKLAIVENFWESGYGMPSFALLGPQVIRLPFILRTSYPHEILHNWWGNGVYVDYSGGNWSEGLTNYLADYLMRELEDQGAAYRRDTLKGYADYVSTAQDFPLREFRGRHGDASQAIGYGKSAMTFHMLRRQLGDETFVRGLKRFYADNRFRAASFDDLRRAFEQASGTDLRGFFEAWTRRTGSPQLALGEVQVERQGDDYRVSGQIQQVQKAPTFPLEVPVIVHQASGPPVATRVRLDGRQASFSAILSSEPIRLAVDPAFDTFRALAPGESPVALSNLFGAERGMLVLPAAADPAMLQGYRDLAAAWLTGHPGWSTATDRDLARLPDDRAVWLLGWENGFLGDFASGGSGFALDRTASRLKIAGQPVDVPNASPVLTRELGGRPVGWLAAANAEALPGLARKLPHYGKYGYLVFQGSAPDNRVKGQWPSGESELVRWLAAPRPDLTLPPEPRLTKQ